MWAGRQVPAVFNIESLQHLSNALLAVKKVFFVGTSEKCALESFQQSQ
jgi:hypothetical protein